MSKRRTILIVVLGVSALGATVQADMMPVFSSAGGCRPSVPTPAAAAVPGANPLAQFDGADVTGVASLPMPSLPASGGAVGQDGETQDVPILADGQNSFSLCLYALLGLGLCRSVPLVRRVSLGYVPQWYHDGGPVQVGHSFPISPDCLSSMSACFVQPVSTVESATPRYRSSAVISYWRESQSGPTVLASRGPPSPCC